MPEQVFENRVVSLSLFKTLHEHCTDFCRKIRFLTKTGFSAHEEAFVLEIISELLDKKEKDLEHMGKRALDECRAESISQESMEMMIGRYLMQHEDYRMLQRLAEIRKNDSRKWETIKALIQSAW
jgi:hypothetical protein